MNAIHRLDLADLTAYASLAPFLRATTSAYWLLIFLLAVPAPFFVLARSRYAEASEQRRCRLFLGGLAAGLLPLFVAVLLEIAIPRWAKIMEEPSNRRAASFVVYGFLLTIPLTLTYATAVRNLLELRFVVHRAVRMALAKSTLWLVASVPWGLLALYLASRRSQPLGEILEATAVKALVAASLTGIFLAMTRRWLLSGLELKLLGKRKKPSLVLASLSRSLSATDGLQSLSNEFREHVADLLQPESQHLLIARSAEGDYEAASGSCRSLSRESAIARLSVATTEPISVDPRDADSWLRWVPETDRLWIADSNVRLLVPISREPGTTSGFLCLGPARTGLPYSGDDRSAAAALAGLLALAASEAAATSEPREGSLAHVDEPAGECRSCGRVQAKRNEPCTCGEALVEAAIPFCLAGKFQLQRVLGRGGMGVVYLGRDLTLERDVALKTLPRVNSAALFRLRREARSMASLIHPNLALIFGAETWRGVPVLVVEFLAGGTLAQRLSHPMEPLEAVRITLALAEALATMHERGFLHRDLKPANIGFTADGQPKLLDFGLVRIIEEARIQQAALPEALWPEEGLTIRSPAREPLLTKTDHIVGTPYYLSPEALQGREPSVAQDLWSLHIVLWEMLAGRHPLQDQSPDEALQRLSRGDLPSIRSVRPECPAILDDLVMESLARKPSSRPQAAREVVERLREVRTRIAS